MTEWERGWYVAHGVDPYRVVATGMGANAVRSHDGAGFRRRHGIPVDAPIVLFIGRRERYKGFIHLLDAAELVWKRYRDARFVFIGVPGFYGAVVDEFARYPDDRIIEIERASATEKAAALDACSLFAMPSLHETFGIGYLEAWLHEKPVIGGDIAPLREVIANGTDGFVVPQKIEDIASAIVALLDDADLRRHMGQAGHAKLLERWDWDRVMDRVEDAYARASNTHIHADEALA
jgi:glycosyltransferase involved in cell wall biosynthesis